MRRRSPLAELRARTSPRLLRPPPELEVDPTAEGASANASYCPVRSWHADERMCADVRCGECRFLRTEVPEQTWVCSSCTAGLLSLPYWKEGECDVCGEESIVLRLAVPR